MLSCRTPPKERVKKGELCERKKKEEYRMKGNKIINLPKGFGADFAALGKDGSITFVDPKYGSGKLTANERRLKETVEKANTPELRFEAPRCDCGDV